MDQSVLAPPEVPEGLTPAAKRARARFYRTYQRHLKKVHAIALSILVWGPTTASASAVAQKRVDIRQALIARGHYAAFSEDFARGEHGSSLKQYEFAQALAADLIIILVEDAPGAIAEAHDFCNHPEIAPNVLIMFPIVLKHGYSAQGAIQIVDQGYGGVYWYEEAEIEECTVMAKAVARAEARRLVHAFVSRPKR